MRQVLPSQSILKDPFVKDVFTGPFVVADSGRLRRSGSREVQASLAQAEELNHTAPRGAPEPNGASEDKILRDFSS
jgi:hypothetical protein